MTTPSRPPESIPELERRHLILSWVGPGFDDMPSHVLLGPGAARQILGTLQVALRQGWARALEAGDSP
jgi:hypothetical protein